MSSGRDLLQQPFSSSDAHAVAKQHHQEFRVVLRLRLYSNARDPDHAGHPENWAYLAGEVLRSESFFQIQRTALRAQGVLDSSTSSRPQVIIPNYFQAASNRIVATPQYHVCCPNHVNGSSTAATKKKSVHSKQLARDVRPSSDLFHVEASNILVPHRPTHKLQQMFGSRLLVRWATPRQLKCDCKLAVNLMSFLASIASQRFYALSATLEFHQTVYPQPRLRVH